MMQAGSNTAPLLHGPPPIVSSRSVEIESRAGADPGRDAGGQGDGLPRANAPLRFSPPFRPLAGASVPLGAGAKSRGPCVVLPGTTPLLPPPAGAGLGLGADPFPGPSAEQLLAQIRGENARLNLGPEQTGTRLDTREVKRLEKAARRAATSAAKAHAKAVGLAQQLGRPLQDLTNDLPMGGGNFGGADGGIQLGPRDPLGLEAQRDFHGTRVPPPDHSAPPTFGRDSQAFGNWERGQAWTPSFAEMGARSALDSMLHGGDGRLPVHGLEAGFPRGQSLGGAPDGHEAGLEWQFGRGGNRDGGHFRDNDPRAGGVPFGGWLHGRAPFEAHQGRPGFDAEMPAGPDTRRDQSAFPPLAPGGTECPGVRLWDAARQGHAPGGTADGGGFRPNAGFAEGGRSETPTFGGGPHGRVPFGSQEGFGPAGGFRPPGPFVYGGQGVGGAPPPGGDCGGSVGGVGSSSHWAPPSNASPPPLEESPWLQASYLLHPPWAGRLTPGSFLEVVTHNNVGAPDGTSIFYLEHVSTVTLAQGAFCEACHCGSSNAQRSAEFDQAFLMDPLTRAALHLCPQAQTGCQELLAGRPTLHVTQARIRDPRGLLEPWFRADARSTPAAGVPGGGANVAQERINDLKAKLSEAKRLNSPAARLALSAQLAQESDSKKRKRKKRKKDASDGSSSESESGALFHSGARPEDRGSMATMRDYSQAHPGRLYEQAMAGVASRLGERVGPGFVVNQPRMSAYLQSVICNKHAKIAVPILRELRTLAEAIDELSAGHVASTADLAMQRFKAIEHSLSHQGKWHLARALEVIRDEDTLVSVEEEVQAAKAVLKRAKLDEIEKKVQGARGSGSGG